MNLANCVQCGAVYVKNSLGLCAACLREEEEAEDKVAGFLREKAKATLDEIHEATGVKHKVILRMLKRGRIRSDAAISYPCETCGTLIDEGRLCDNCSGNITRQLKPEEWKPKEKPSTESKGTQRLHIKDLLDNK
ncbi:MAG: YvyF: flagellar operon protein [Firmicutes bacterium]|nr:YvyF: flagellar operon protein [Bacillota bacterium]